MDFNSENLEQEHNGSKEAGNRPRRPRINTRPSGDGAYQERRYNNRLSTNNSFASNRDDRQAGGEYRPRYNNNGGQSDYNRQPRQEGGYGQRRQYNNNGNQGGYQGRNQGGYNNRQSGYSQDNGYGQRRQYNKDGNQGGYNNNYGEGGYQRRPNNRRYNNQGGGYNQGGYGNNQGGYGNNRNQGYGRGNNGGGYNRNNRFNQNNDSYNPNAKYSQKKQIEYKKQYVDLTQPMRLNKFLANAGLCSRREADEFIQSGVVSVNGTVVTELGSKIIPATDKVLFHDQLVRSEKKVYILLNKPKDCVTTVEDAHAQMTVLDLVRNACSERVYPVGRLDRNTTGVLLITNDGDLTSKLTHPKYDKKKIYQVTLDKDLTDEDFEKISNGVVLEDGEIKVDELSFIYDGDRRNVGVEIHSGKNRIVRRIFDSLGYHVIKLDRVYFAGLTKKNLPRGRWRYLSEMEVNMLKMSAAVLKD